MMFLYNINNHNEKKSSLSDAVREFYTMVKVERDMINEESLGVKRKSALKIIEMSII